MAWIIQQWEPSDPVAKSKTGRWMPYSTVSGEIYRFESYDTAQAAIIGVQAAWEGTSFPVRLAEIGGDQCDPL